MNGLIIKKSNRRSSAIQIYPDCRVVISVPLFFTDSEIQKFIDQKKNWMETHLKRFAKLPQPRKKREMVTGETFPVLGEEFRLQLITSKTPAISIHSNGILILAKHQTQAKILLQEWYQVKAAQVFRERTEQYSRRLGVNPSSVTIKNYKSRWGACNIQGEIYYNWRLAMAPLHIIDYVVVHELCHLKEYNHSKRFWAHVASVFPEYKSAKKWLRIQEYKKELEF